MTNSTKKYDGLSPIMSLIYSLRIFLFALVLLEIDLSHSFNVKIQDMLTDDEYLKIFHTDRSEVPDHEFIRVNSSPVVQLRERLSSQNRILSFTAFGRRYDLQLQLRDNVLIGKNTPIWHADIDPENSSRIIYTQLPNVLDDISGIYQDLDNMVSLLESSSNVSDDVFYDGIISSDVAISPLPQRLIGIISNISDDNAMIKDHVVYKIKFENLTSDAHYSASEIERKYDSHSIRQHPLDTFYPEVLVVIDASMYKHFGKKPHFALNYLVPFWNAVDLRYKLLNSPEVKLNIAGVILSQDEKALAFLHSNMDENGRIHAKKALLDAGHFYYSDTSLVSRDVVVIMTKHDICSVKYANYCKSSAIGKAFTGKACSKKKNTAILEDNGGYGGIITATHEIGHLLGLPHDGEDEAAECSIQDGYIMASAKYRSVNSLCWSSCSKKILERFSSLTASNCLENKPKNLGDSIKQTLPGRVLTLEEQCLARGGKPCVFNATVCWKLYCTKSMLNKKCIGKAPAAEGTTCGDGLYCRNGDCIADA
uniref:Peptidase M12B domain-containing protein n=1 Tax=Trichogramma kaykai TaxID=54128 RepID=A0ABD2WY24_9HYME